MGLTVKGQSGALWRGYQRVATLGAWTVDEHGVLEADASEINEVWADGPGPLSVQLLVGRSRWTWPVHLSSLGPRVRGDVQGKPDIR